MAIHQKLKQLRLQKNLSQTDVAEALHISQNAYSLIETGRTKLDEQRINELAVLLQVHPIDLFNDNNIIMHYYNKIENEYSSYIQTLNADNNDLVEQLKDQLVKKDKQIEKLLHQNKKLTELLIK